MAELADSLALGFLVLLESLEPVERAVLLLADVYRVHFGEISEAVERSPAACRQVASRARRRFREDRSPLAPRAEADPVVAHLPALRVAAEPVRQPPGSRGRLLPVT